MSDLQRLRELLAQNQIDAAHELALVMLAKSRRREIVEAALNALEGAELAESARPPLRAAALYYFDTPSQDKTVAARERILRLLATSGNPGDLDIYLRGVNTYEVQPFLGEVAHNLRAVSLVALALIDAPLGNLYATKLLSELDHTSVYNGEPAVTALNLLYQQGQTLPIYQYILLGGLDALEAGLNEVVGKALELLGADFPASLYAPLVDLFVPRDRALVSMGLLSHIVDNRVEALYPAVETIITGTRHHDLHNFAVVLLAASRDDTLIALLMRLAKTAPQHRIANFIAALELIPGEEKDELIAGLKKRL